MGSSVHITGKEDRIPSELRLKSVELLTFNFHLPFLLQCPSPVPDPIGLEDYSCTMTFEVAERSVAFGDGHKVVDPYTIGNVSLLWPEAKQIALERLVEQPLVEWSRVPIELLNCVVEAYQLLTGDYLTHKLHPLEILHATGSIRLVGVEDALTFYMEHERKRPSDKADRLVPGRLLYFAEGLISDKPIWLARKCFNSAQRQLILKDASASIVECVTCIEILASYVSLGVALHSGVDGEHRRSRLRGLGRILRRIAALRREIEPTLIEQWLRSVYSVRNKIVHEGLRLVDLQEASALISLTGALAQALEAVATEAR